MRSVLNSNFMNYMKGIVRHTMNRGQYSFVNKRVSIDPQQGKYTYHSMVQSMPPISKMPLTLVGETIKKEARISSSVPLRERVSSSIPTVNTNKPVRTSSTIQPRKEQSPFTKNQDLYASLKRYMDERFPQPIGDDAPRSSISSDQEQETKTKITPKSLSENPTLWANRNALQAQLEKILGKS